MSSDPGGERIDHFRRGLLLREENESQAQDSMVRKAIANLLACPNLACGVLEVLSTGNARTKEQNGHRLCKWHVANDGTITMSNSMEPPAGSWKSAVIQSNQCRARS